MEKAINILYNIINSIKYGDTSLDKEKKDDNLLDELITNYNLIENFMDILNKYFIENNQIITDIIIKTILKTIAIILEASLKGMDKILSSKFLEIIAGTINNEFNIDSKSNNNKNNNNNNKNNVRRNSGLLNRRGIMFLHEFFDILIALFPSWKFNAKNQKKILSDENKKYYEFFCQNIFLPLINNITNKSSSLILTNLSKLILAFINNSNKDDVILFLPSKPISKIIIKLLDTKNNSNVIDAFSLIKSLLEKVPENYIVNFVREGIVHNLKNYKFQQKTVEKKPNTFFRDFDKYLLSPFQTRHELDLNFKNFKSKEKLKEKESDKDKNEEDKNKNIFGNKDKDKDKDKDKIELDSSDGIEIFKEKKIEDNIISIKKINTNSRKSKESLKLSLNDIMGEENDNEYKLRLESEAENPEEEQEDEEMDNNEESGRVEDSENEEKEENEDKDDGKNSFYISQSYSEDNDKEKEKEKEKDKDKDKDKEKLKDEEIEKKSKKEKENKEVKNLNININFTPKLKTQAQKETKLKKLEFNYDEFSDNKNSNSNLNINDIFMVDDKSQNEKNEKKIEKDKIIEKIDEKSEEENIKFNIGKNRKLNSEDPFSFLHRRRRFKDYLKQRMNYEDLEDNLSNLEMKTIQEKNKDLLTNYLSDEMTKKYRNIYLP